MKTGDQPAREEDREGPGQDLVPAQDHSQVQEIFPLIPPEPGILDRKEKRFSKFAKNYLSQVNWRIKVIKKRKIFSKQLTFDYFKIYWLIFTVAFFNVSEARLGKGRRNQHPSWQPGMTTTVGVRLPRSPRKRMPCNANVKVLPL